MDSPEKLAGEGRMLVTEKAINLSNRYRDVCVSLLVPGTRQSCVRCDSLISIASTFTMVC